MPIPPIQMQLTAEPVGNQYHLKGYVAYYGLGLILVDDALSIRLAGTTETIDFSETMVIEISRFVEKSALDANLETKVRFQSFTDYKLASERTTTGTFTGTFEPMSLQGVLVHKGLR